MASNDRSLVGVVEPLDWDSSFYGFAVGRVSVESIPQFHAGISAAKLAGIRLVYGFCPAGCVSEAAASELPASSLICTHLLFERRAAAIRGQVPDDYWVEQYSAEAPEPRLAELAESAGQFSRFRIDIRLPPGSFEGMYQTWITRSVAGEFADIVYVIRNGDGDVAGFVTASMPSHDVCVIGLLAVSEEHQKRGLGRVLLDAIIAFADERGSSRIEVTTQANNLGAVRLYESAGFRVKSRTAVFHFWLD